MAEEYDRHLTLKPLEGALWMQALIYEHLAAAVIAELGERRCEDSRRASAADY